MSTESTTLTSQSLAQKLLTSAGTLEELLEHFAAEAEQLTQLLHSREFHDHLQLRTDLALAQARLQAAAALPDCTAKLLALTNAEKPEVARRAIMALIGITGLPTRVAPAPAPEPAPPDDPDDDDQDDDDQDDAPAFETDPNDDLTPEERRQRAGTVLHHAKRLRFMYGIDLAELPDTHIPYLSQYLTNFYRAAKLPLPEPLLVSKSPDFPPAPPLPEIPPDPSPANPNTNTNTNINQKPNDSALFTPCP